MSFVSATTQETPPQWDTFLDMQLDVKPWLNIPAGVSSSDPKLQMVVDSACSFVQDYLSRPITPTELFRRYNGNEGFEGAHIMLPYYPVLQVISVVEYWGNSGPHTLLEQTPERQGGSDMYQVDPTTGRLTRSFLGNIERPWFVGARNVEVTWVAGFNPLPQTIRLATLILIQHWFQRYQEASRTFPLPAGAMTADMMPTGLFSGLPPDVERLLQPYVTLSMP